MTITYHRTVETLASFGDYSPVARAVPGEIVAVAGQFGTDRTGSFPDGDSAEEQVRGAFANVGNALQAAGLGYSDILKFNTYLVGRDTIPAFMKVRKEVFADIYPNGDDYPPNTLLLVTGLVEERFLVEIEAIAVRGEVSRATR
jgi:enamine deaminase RidA (YjgF/YER057c/UK114 family)